MEGGRRTSHTQACVFCLSSGGRRRARPMARRACCSSRVKVVRGTSSDTGRTATVDRLDAWFPASH